MMRVLRTAAVLCVMAVAPSCSGGSESTGENGSGTLPGDADSGSYGTLDGGSGSSDNGAAALLDGSACATASSDVRLTPLHLAFAFDVSGSMGKGDKLYHDKALKWDPVVAATRSFFAQPANDVYASLTFFPAAGGEDDRCDRSSYLSPDVPMMALPSSAFASAIEEVEPQSRDDWRGGTPTVAVVQGTLAFLDSYRALHAGRYAMVLVTDGYPEGCDEANDNVAAVVREVERARGADVSTYVIGIANPPVANAPDAVADLHEIAEAGRTGRAFLIDTGMASATASAFGDAVQAIREAAASCSVAIPAESNGRAFDKRRVQVQLEQAGVPMLLDYSADCTQGFGWRYDDVESPTSIDLCEQACSAVRASGGSLKVQFACSDVLLL